MSHDGNAMTLPDVRAGVSAAGSAVRWSLAACLLAGCPTSPDAAESAAAAQNPQAAQALAPLQPQCPSASIARAVAPDVSDAHRDPQTWLDKLDPGQAEAVLVAPPRVETLNAAFSEIPGAFRDPLSAEIADPANVATEVAERTGWMRARVDEGRYVQTTEGALTSAEQVVGRAAAVDELRWMVGEAPLWCVPLTSGLFKEPIDPTFDRNRCASVHPGELVRVLRRAEGSPTWSYLDTGHTTGWVADAVMTPPLPIEHMRPLWTGPRLVPMTDAVQTTDGHRIRLGTHVPLRGQDEDGYSVLVPTTEGPVQARVAKAAAVHVGPRPLTRRNLWTMAFAELDSPYGWGGTAGARDCSRFLRDLMVTFGIELARHSGVQAKLGTERVNVGGMTEAAKRSALAKAAQRGVVFLYMPGHIMMYLGRESGRDYAISAISEWLEPCPGGKDTVYRLDRVAVTTLELGRDTERTSYIERITTLVVYGPEPTPAG